MKKLTMMSVLTLVMVVLAGCMYPEDQKAKNQIPYEDQINQVQNAIDGYKEKNQGLLPIKTTEKDTPIYQKYPIDFKKIIPQYMAEYPGNSFEAGGVFQYVLINAETEPEVKLSDLRIAEMIRDIKIRIRSQGYPPYKDHIAGNVYSLDYSKLGYKEDPVVYSPFSGQDLPFVVTGDGEVYVDYRIDLMQIIQKGDIDYQPGDDIRGLLVRDSAFVPAYSLPYTIDSETNDPIFLVN
ncbi:hypothetical protein [Cytobacillus purgationiresistens]|uniref:ABC transporter periplasmic binding protein yphF n=1 Tax=Cytobacillus purgationiresistens TaxID=863449 RepID=A0ABU0AIK6_9BACI|nr:hypothetical protein [Cytobacillus purgationiresistens]MDQ0271088.1 hypothetical protein [Cytobacillus purgationiresistens]